jgi:hypothetical protein
MAGQLASLFLPGRVSLLFQAIPDRKGARLCRVRVPRGLASPVFQARQCKNHCISLTSDSHRRAIVAPVAMEIVESPSCEVSQMQAH